MAPEEDGETVPTTAESASASAHVQVSAPTEPKENILSTPDETTDIILEVEGKEFHASRAVLAHYSPVFRSMFYSDFKEKSSEKVPLPGKQYATMVTFCNVLYPRSASAKCLIDDDNLIPLLTLADEYQADPVKVECQTYIRDQLFNYFLHFYRHAVQITYSRSTPKTFQGLYETNLVLLRPAAMTGQKLTKEELIQKLVLYLWACDAYQLPAHREVVKSLLLDLSNCLKDVAQSKHYPSLLPVSKVDLLEALCSKLDGSQE